MRENRDVGDGRWCGKTIKREVGYSVGAPRHGGQATVQKHHGAAGGLWCGNTTTW